MFIYNHHIRDFNNATQHLTPVEQVFYIRLIWLYYDTEKPLQNSDFDLLSRKISAKTDEEKEAVKTALNEFFHNEKDGYHNNRCDEEIEKFLNNLTSKSKAGKASVAARKKLEKKKKKGNLTGVEQVLNSVGTKINVCDKPLALSDKPKAIVKENTKEKNISPLARLISLNVEEQNAKDWLKIRKEKRLAFTEAALNIVIKAAKTGNMTLNQAIKICCDEGWGTLNLSWERKHNKINGTEHRKTIWYETEDATMVKGTELGIKIQPGENLGSYRTRIQERINELRAT